MPGWQNLREEAPELAAEVERRFAVRKHCTIATLRRDGSPRISGIEVEFSKGQVWLGSMPGAVKAADLQRDGRFALHSPTVDPPEDDPGAWEGEAKLAGRAEEMPREDGAAHRFRLDIAEAVLTRVAGGELEIRSWHAGRGERTIRRA